VPKKIDWTGRKIGRVNVISLLIRTGGGSKWNCKCACGNEFVCWAVSFKRGKKFECKQCWYERRRGIDLTGRKYGRWTVLNRKVDDRNKTKWVVRCDCGNLGEVDTCSLGKKGRSMSCGCLGRKEKSKWVNDTLYPPMHRTSITRIYKIRTRIVHSCYKPKHQSYKNFGKKGYTVCELWKNGAEDFFNWCMENNWKPSTVVAIKDGETNFCPENCYLIEEGEHIRQRLIKKITLGDVTKTTIEWAKETGLNPKTLNWRLRNGYTPEEAVFSKSHQFSGTRDYPDEEIKKLYESGLSCADVGRKIGDLSYSSVSKRLKSMGIEVSSKGRRKYTERVCNICNKIYVPTSSRQRKCSICKLNRK